MRITARGGTVLLAAGAVLLGLALHAANLYCGDLNQDEGWYLHAARQIRAGLLPYRDFLFSQAPVVAYAFALLEPLWRVSPIAGGRLLNAALGFTGALLAAWAAARMAPPAVRRYAAITCLVLIADNIYQSYFTTVIKTYSLTALFLSAGFLALSFVHARGGRAAAGLAGVCMALSAGTRFSSAFALPVAGLYLIWQRRRVRPGTWLVFGAAAAAALAALYGPWLALAPDGFLFGLSVHGARDPGGLAARLLFKAGFVSRVVRAYFVAVLLGGAAAYLGWVHPRRVSADRPVGSAPPRFGWAVGGAALAISAVHFMAPFPYDDYQVPVFPLFAVAVAVGLWGALDPLLAGPGRAAALQGLILIAACLGAGSSEINQDWFILRRDRLWWLRKPQCDLRVLQKTAAFVRGLHPTPAEMATHDTYLAVEAGWTVPRGFDVGPFTYFPGLPTEQARRYKVLNRELAVRFLETTDAPVAAFSGYGFGIAAPGMTPVPAAEREALLDIVRRRYRLVRTVPDFGQAHTPLTIWLRQDLAGPEPEGAAARP
jgi:hypothetical protein